MKNLFYQRSTTVWPISLILFIVRLHSLRYTTVNEPLRLLVLPGLLSGRNEPNGLESTLNIAIWVIASRCLSFNTSTYQGSEFICINKARYVSNKSKCFVKLFPPSRIACFHEKMIWNPHHQHHQYKSSATIADERETIFTLSQSHVQFILFLLKGEEKNKK